MINTTALSRIRGYSIKKHTHKMMIRFDTETSPVSRVTFRFEILYREGHADFSDIGNDLVIVNGNTARLDFDSIYLDLCKAASLGSFTTKTLYGLVNCGLSSRHFELYFMSEYLVRKHNIERLGPLISNLDIPCIILSMEDIRYERTLTQVHSPPFLMSDVASDSEIGKAFNALCAREYLSADSVLRLLSEAASGMKQMFSVTGMLDLVVHEKDSSFPDPDFTLGASYSVYFVSPDGTGMVNPKIGTISHGIINVIHVPYGKKYNREKMLKYSV